MFDKEKKELKEDIQKASAEAKSLLSDGKILAIGLLTGTALIVGFAAGVIVGGRRR